MPHPASVRKLWGYCNVLGDDWMSYGDCAEQLTYLLFLKMADEGRKRNRILTVVKPHGGRKHCHWLDVKDVIRILEED